MSTKDSTIRIWHENFGVSNPEGTGNLLPLQSLTTEEHIHGTLHIWVDHRLLPHLGHFGPDDVCFNTWLVELHAVAKAFTDSDKARYVFDEGEQGQPAYVFERDGDSAFVTIADSAYSGGQCDADWQRVEFSPIDFLREYKRFISSFLETLRKGASHVADQWLAKHLPDFQDE